MSDPELEASLEQFRRDQTVPESRAEIMRAVAPLAGLRVDILGGEGYTYRIDTYGTEPRTETVGHRKARISVSGNVEGKDDAIRKLYELLTEEEQLEGEIEGELAPHSGSSSAEHSTSKDPAQDRIHRFSKYL